VTAYFDSNYDQQALRNIVTWASAKPDAAKQLRATWTGLGANAPSIYEFAISYGKLPSGSSGNGGSLGNGNGFQNGNGNGVAQSWDDIAAFDQSLISMYFGPGGISDSVIANVAARYGVTIEQLANMFRNGSRWKFYPSGGPALG
jgi:hypothetical protein